MPNTPAAIGRGVTAAFASAEVAPDAAALDRAPVGAVGAFHWVDEESAIDAVTAISGGGPAYVFALTEALAAAAETLGLPAELAMSLARGTVEGAGELMRREPDTPPSVLRRDVNVQRFDVRAHRQPDDFFRQRANGVTEAGAFISHRKRESFRRPDRKNRFAAGVGAP